MTAMKVAVGDESVARLRERCAGLACGNITVRSRRANARGSKGRCFVDRAKTGLLLHPVSLVERLFDAYLAKANIVSVGDASLFRKSQRSTLLPGYTCR